MTNRRRLRTRVGIGLLIVACFGPGAVAATAAPGLPSLGREDSSHVLRGTFVQHKHLAELDRALVSSGRYTVARGRGLLWQVEKPVKSTLVITPNALTETSNGRQTAQITAQQQPALGAVAAILLAVFRGNTAQLSRYFDIRKPDERSADQTLILKPKTEAVRGFIKSLKLTVNGNAIRRIRINQPGGDYSVIDLDPSGNAASDTLTPEERRAFSR